jgi:hypothetical protein
MTFKPMLAGKAPGGRQPGQRPRHPVYLGFRDPIDL